MTLFTKDSIHYFLDTVPLMTEQDFERLDVYASSNSKSMVFSLEFSGRGKTRFRYLKASRSMTEINEVAIVIDGQLMGISIILPDTSASVYTNSFQQVPLLADRDWVEKIQVSLNSAWQKPRKGKEFVSGATTRTYYENGKCYTESIATDIMHTRYYEYYENGKCAFENIYGIDSINGIEFDEYSRRFDVNGRPQNAEYLLDGTVVMTRLYYPDGKVQSDMYNYETPIGEAVNETEYDTSGFPSYERKTEFIGEYKGEFDIPQVMHIKNLQNGVPVSEGAMYAGCGECEWDSCGTWKFYRNGKLVRTKRFPSGQSMMEAQDRAADSIRKSH